MGSFSSIPSHISPQQVVATPESHFHWIGDSNVDFILALSSLHHSDSEGIFFDRSDWKNGAGMQETESFWEESYSSISVIGGKGERGKIE